MNFLIFFPHNLKCHLAGCKWIDQRTEATDPSDGENNYYNAGEDQHPESGNNADFLPGSEMIS